MKEFILLRLLRIKGFLRKESKFKFILYIIVLSIFFFGTYYFFFKIFSFLKNIEDIGEIISGKIISYSFFVFFFMLFISNGITSLSTFYRSNELSFLFSLPVDTMNIFFSKLMENIFFSSWATMIGGLPILFSYLNAFKKPFSTFILILPLLLFISIPSFISIIFLLVLKRFNPKLSVKKLAFYLGAFSFIVVYLYVRTNPYSFTVPFSYDLKVLNKFLDSLRFTNPYFPNEWFFTVAHSVIKMDLILFFKYTLALLLLSIITFIILYIFASLWYKKTWLNDEGLKVVPNITTKFYIKKIPLFLNLVSKDFRIFFRSPSQWIQFLVIFTLLIFYVISLRNTPLYFKDPFWLTITALINTAFVGYITATLSLRFVYPSLSLESPYFWIYKSTPIKPKVIFISKIFFYILLSTIMTILVVYYSNIRLTNDIGITLFTIIIGLLFSITIVILSGSFGIFFIEFNEDNPAKIASGPGGLLTAIISFLYIGGTLFIFFQPFSYYVSNLINSVHLNIWGITLKNLIIFAFITVLINLILLLLGLKKIEYVEK